MITIKFYTTDACTLCEEALAIVKVCVSKKNHQLEMVDIVDQDDLIKQYATKIPVLGRDDNKTCLCWPFSPAEVQDFLL